MLKDFFILWGVLLGIVTTGGALTLLGEWLYENEHYGPLALMIVVIVTGLLAAFMVVINE